MLVKNDTLEQIGVDGVSQRRTFAVIASCLLFGLTTVTYWPACANGFVKWDDLFYVYEQPRILQGISWDGIRWAFTSDIVGNWHPLTMISLQLDAHLFGHGPYGFHRTAVLLHSLNSVLAFVTVLKLTGCRWRSVICGFLFALHPMRVESVAWVSERKDLLSGTFFFLTILGYVGYVRGPSVARFLLIMVWLTLGLSSKAMLVTTPCVLLLLDYWPLGRCRGFGVSDRVVWMGLIREKLPLLALSLFVSILTLNLQQHGMSSLEDVTLGFRLKNAVVSYLDYLSQSFWPVGLSPMYIRHEVLWWQLSMAAVALIVLTGVAIWRRNQQPYLLVGWFWFLGMLVPVIGLLQAGTQSHADRYMYLSQMGLCLAVVWWVSDLVEHSDVESFAATALAAAFIAGCGYATTQQIPVWRDTESLWLQAVRVDPANQFALHHLTWFYIEEGKRDEAIQAITNAVPIRDASELKNQVSLAKMLADHGEDDATVAALSRALEFDREQADLFSNRGKALASLGRWNEAADDYRQASKLSPKSVSYQFYLAHALSKSGNQQAAEEIYQAAIRQAPDWPLSAAKMAWNMSTNPEPRLRVASWPVQLAEQANEATGGSNPQILDVLAATYADAGRFDEAAKTAELAVQAAENRRKPAAFIAAVRKRRELYQAQTPYRELPSK